jgi:SAM-dependent methyltransferase
MASATDNNEPDTANTPPSVPSVWQDSAALYDAFAAEWDACFDAANHRNAYDLLAWEYVTRFLPPAPAAIVDVGCGTGRWCGKLLSLGHHVVGIEQAPEMIKVLAAKGFGPRLTLIAGSMETVRLPPASADIVLAIGSVQYARDPARMIRRFASWAKPGGRVLVCVDSLVALILELVSLHKVEEALRILHTGRGVFTHGGKIADLHVYDRRTMESYFTAAGLIELDCRGLLLSMSAFGRDRCAHAIASDRAGFLDSERKLAEFPATADIGKHIILCGRRPLRRAEDPQIALADR